MYCHQKINAKSYLWCKQLLIFRIKRNLFSIWVNRLQRMNIFLQTNEHKTKIRQRCKVKSQKCTINGLLMHFHPNSRQIQHFNCCTYAIIKQIHYTSAYQPNDYLIHVRFNKKNYPKTLV